MERSVRERESADRRRTRANGGTFANLDLLKWLHDVRKVVPDMISFHDDMQEDEVLELLAWLYEVDSHGSAWWYITKAVMRRGHLRAAVWIHQHNKSMEMEIAAESGRLNVVQWFENILQWNTSPNANFSSAMNRAARNGHLDIVQWLHKNNRSGRCRTDAMDGAAEKGHLEVVQWLHKNRSEGCTDQALWSATKNGHFAVVQYLVSNGLVKYAVKELILAASSGHLEILAWLHERGEYNVTPAKIL